MLLKPWFYKTDTSLAFQLNILTSRTVLQWTKAAVQLSWLLNSTIKINYYVKLSHIKFPDLFNFDDDRKLNAAVITNFHHLYVILYMKQLIDRLRK